MVAVVRATAESIGIPPRATRGICHHCRMSFDAGFNQDSNRDYSQDSSGPGAGSGPPEKEPAAAKPVRRSKVSWQTRAVLAVLLLVLLVVAGAVMSTVLPVWWATTIGTQVGGDLGGSILVGMFYGFTFTLVPLLVAWQARYKRVGWPLKAALLVVAVLLAAPNLLTAGIALGSSNSAHQAQRILGTEATWFIPWTLYSAIAAALVFAAIALLWSTWRRRGRELKGMRAAERERSRPVPPAGPGPASGPDEPGTLRPEAPGEDPGRH
jgi:hypothetical protein